MTHRESLLGLRPSAGELVEVVARVDGEVHGALNRVGRVQTLDGDARSVVPHVEVGVS